MSATRTDLAGLELDEIERLLLETPNLPEADVPPGVSPGNSVVTVSVAEVEVSRERKSVTAQVTPRDRISFLIAFSGQKT